LVVARGLGEPRAELVDYERRLDGYRSHLAP
jgi:hypothetical protein